MAKPSNAEQGPNPSSVAFFLDTLQRAPSFVVEIEDGRIQRADTIRTT